MSRNSLEQQVWAAAFANEFAKDREYAYSRGNGHYTVDDISGYSCAEVADKAVLKLREAIDSDTSSYLIPNKEKWI